MKTIEDIYNEYHIIPSLRMHMYRVAAVAQILCENMDTPVDTKSVIATCLLHDMGNIIKFDFETFPDFFAKEGKEYWQGIQKEFHEKYHTTDEHHATLAIAVEVDANLHTLELLHACGFSKAVAIDTAPELEKKICLYADLRVAPLGVVSLEERLGDLEKRYGGRSDAIHGRNRDDVYNAIWNIEQELFGHTKITPASITEEYVQEIITTLQQTVIH